MHIIGVVILFASGVASLFAALNWINVHFSFNYLIKFVVIMGAFIVQPIGGIAISIAGFLGMTELWRWPWWWAFIVAAPGVGLTLIFVIGGALQILFGRL